MSANTDIKTGKKKKKTIAISEGAHMIAKLKATKEKKDIKAYIEGLIKKDNNGTEK